MSSVIKLEAKPQTVPHFQATQLHASQAATWANTSIIPQKFPHQFDEIMLVLVILSYIIEN
jgi:hypothetical protein